MASHNGESKERRDDDNVREERKAAARGAIKSAASLLIPGLSIPLATYEALKQERKERAYREFRETIQARVEELGSKFDPRWLESEEGKIFAGKVIDAALDAQMADKTELFANALVNGAKSDSAPFVEKAKFIDLLCGLSRLALDVLERIHRRFGPIVTQPLAQRSASTLIVPVGLAEELSEGMDPNLFTAGIDELRAAGLFSGAPDWYKDTSGVPRPRSSHGSGGYYYTAFTERFVQFVSKPHGS